MHRRALTMRLLFVCPDMRTGGAERHWATLIPRSPSAAPRCALLCLADEGALFGELTRRRRARPRACTWSAAPTRAAGGARSASPGRARTWWSRAA